MNRFLRPWMCLHCMWKFHCHSLITWKTFATAGEWVTTDVLSTIDRVWTLNLNLRWKMGPVSLALVMWKPRIGTVMWLGGAFCQRKTASKKYKHLELKFLKTFLCLSFITLLQLMKIMTNAPHLEAVARRIVSTTKCCAYKPLTCRPSGQILSGREFGETKWLMFHRLTA